MSLVSYQLPKVKGGTVSLKSGGGRGRLSAIYPMVFDQVVQQHDVITKEK